MKSINYPKVVGWRRLLVTNLLILCFFIGGTASAFNSEAAMQQKMSIRIESATIRKVLSAIQNKSEFVFLISDEVNQELNKKVSVNAQNESIETILNDVTRGTKIAYKVVGRQISIYKSAQQKNKTIKGKVIDEKGEPIIGASITVNGSKTGAITNVNGDFTLSGVTSNAVLTVSYIGFTTKNVKVGGQQNFNITLIEDTKNLDEVVVVGYGSQKKLSLTGSVASTTGKELVKNSSTNLTQSLAGRMPGMVINNRSGEPGNDNTTIFIRGRSTLGDNSPLIVIDGITGRGSLDRLNPDDIESITVLKDASAAIYGARSANGVILVTTKRGKAGEKPEINFNYDLAVQQPTRLVDMCDAVDYAKAYNVRNTAIGSAPRYTDAEIDLFKSGTDQVLYPNTDWTDALLKKNTLQHKMGLSLSGGTKRLTYYLSLDGNIQDGIYKNGNTNFDIMRIRSNVDVKVTNNFKIGVDLAARLQNKKYSSMSSSDYGFFYSLKRAFPTSPIVYPNGLPASTLALVMTGEGGYRKLRTTRFESTVTGTWDLSTILPGLQVLGHVAYDTDGVWTKRWGKPITYYTYNVDNGEYEERQSTSWVTPSLLEDYTTTHQLTLNAQIDYNHTFAKLHNVGVMLGFEQNSWHKDWFDAERNRYSSSIIDEMFAGDLDKTYYDNDGSASETARRGFFGRATYDYAGKYMLQALFRYDGSENFAKGHRWGFFPGASVGWRISEEKFIKDNFDWIQNLKLRASYGEQGNDLISAFQYLTTYSYGYHYSSTTGTPVLGGTEVQGLIPGVFPNPNVTWEVAKTWNFGLDGSLWNGLLDFEFEYFKTRRSNILCTRNASVPSYTGLTSLPAENIGIVDNKGFELQLSHRNRIGKLNYQVSGNVMHAKNKVIYMDETPYGDGHEYMNLTGKPMGSPLLYHTIGINKTAEDLANNPQYKGAILGDFIFEDVDKDGKITSNDRIRQDKCNIPEWVFGLTISAQWKNFDFMILFQGQAGAKVELDPNIDPAVGNVEKYVIDGAWTADNPTSNKPAYGSTSVNQQATTYWYKDASFIRLKNMEIGYTFANKGILNQIGISRMRMYIGGFNLLTFDKLKYMDPETTATDSGIYPQQRIFNAGIKITF